MNMNPSTLPVSIAMATYNGARFLDEQLASIAKQEMLPAELVVTDDGSTDATPEIISRFASTVPFPVRFFPNPTRLNFAGNFLRAASLCESPIIAFSDQDDVWLPSKLSKSLPYFVDPSVNLVMHTGSVWDGERITGKFPEFRSTEILPPLSVDPLSFYPGNDMMFRADILQEYTDRPRPRDRFGLIPPHVSMNHDSWVWLLACCLGKTVTLHESYILYRQHGANTIGSPTAPSWKLALQDMDYDGLASIEEENGAVFLSISQSSSSQERRAHAQTAAAFFARRAENFRTRAAIYDPRHGVVSRASAFTKLVARGAYRDDRARRNLGRKAAVKDLVYSLIGRRGAAKSMPTQ